MTSADLISKVRARLGTGDDELELRVIRAEADARKAYFRSVALGEDEAKRNLIFQDFTVALTSGVGALTTHFGATQPLIASSDKCWRVLVAGESDYSSWLPDLQSLRMGRNKLVSYFAVSGTVFGTRDRTGSLTGFTAVNATVSGPAVLSLSNVPSQLEDEIADAVALMLSGGES